MELERQLKCRMVPIVLDEQKNTPMEGFINLHQDELVWQYALLSEHMTDGIMSCEEAFGLLARKRKPS